MKCDKIKKCDEWISSFKNLFDTYNSLINMDKYKGNIMSIITLDSYEINDERFFMISINLEDIKHRKEVTEEVNLFLDEKYITEFMYIASNVISYYLEKVCQGKEVKQRDFYKIDTKDGINSYLDISGLFDAKFTNEYNEITYFDDVTDILIDNSNKGVIKDNHLIFDLFKNAFNNEPIDDNVDISIHTLKDQNSVALVEYQQLLLKK